MTLPFSLGAEAGSGPPAHWHERLPPDCLLPDPRADLVQLVRAVVRYLGGAFPPQGEVPAEGPVSRLPLSRRQVVLLLVDGLGEGFLLRSGHSGFLHQHRLGALSSVFPSTTASAIASVMTGLWPIQHGLLGWFIRDERFGGILAPLPLTLRQGGEVEGLLRLRRLFPYPSLFQRLPVPSTVVAPREIVDTPFNRRHARGAWRVGYQGLDGLVAAIHEAVRAQPGGGGYVYAYYSRLDAMAHAFGVGSARVAQEFGKVEAAITLLAERLSGLGVDLLVTADHGFVDVPPGQTLEIAAWPEIAPLLAAPLWGERRAGWCAVRPGAEQDFETAMAARLGSAGRVVPTRAIPPAELLGQGRPHSRLGERMGSHGIFMAPGWALRDRVPGEAEHPMIGLHGGLSADEMRVPLIHIDCG